MIVPIQYVFSQFPKILFNKTNFRNRKKTIHFQYITYRRNVETFTARARRTLCCFSSFSFEKLSKRIGQQQQQQKRNGKHYR